MNWTVIGAISALLATIAGAAGSHAIPQDDATALRIFDVAARYQMYHAFGMIACGLLPRRSRLSAAAGWCFLCGSVIFCGSLYARGLGWISHSPAPAGGVLLMAGWAMMAWSQLNRSKT